MVSKARSGLSHVDDGAAVEREPVDTSLDDDLQRRLGVTVDVQRHVAAVGAYYQRGPAADEARHGPLGHRSVPVAAGGGRRVVAVVDGHDRRVTLDTGRDAQRELQVRAARVHDRHEEPASNAHARAGRLSLLSSVGRATSAGHECVDRDVKYLNSTTQQKAQIDRQTETIPNQALRMRQLPRRVVGLH